MKIEEQVLSREQMAHLVELGVDTSDASMMWYRCDDGNTERWYLQINNELSNSLARIMKGTVGCLVPTYTIGDLIDKLPKWINSDGHDYSLMIEYFSSCLTYTYMDAHEMMDELTLVENYYALKDALYNLLCWVAENHKELIK